MSYFICVCQAEEDDAEGAERHKRSCNLYQCMAGMESGLIETRRELENAKHDIERLVATNSELATESGARGLSETMFNLNMERLLGGSYLMLRSEGGLMLTIKVQIFDGDGDVVLFECLHGIVPGNKLSYHFEFPIVRDETVS